MYVLPLGGDTKFHTHTKQVELELPYTTQTEDIHTGEQ